ncbi:MAG: deoxyribose-phosphate aldolase [Planctomycetota bacterium]|jgi:deoxyribose-phosphate aldolase
MSNSEHKMSEKELAGCIDHAMLRPGTTEEEIEQLCAEAIECGFYSVCVNPRWVSFAADKLHGSKIKVGSVISFPFGADSTKAKAGEAKEVIFAGADEIDMVADLAAIIDGDERYLLRQLRAVLRVCRSMRPAVCLKVIIESAALTKDQKIFACQVAEKAGVDFIKTSTGFHPAGGATVEDVKLIKERSPGCKVKASGGIKTVQQALGMLEAGAERLGMSSGVQILKQLRAGE